MFYCIDDMSFTKEFDIMDITDTARSASYLDLYLEMNGEYRLRTKLIVVSIFPLLTFHLYVALSQQYLHMEYIPVDTML
jgi:hypothetical protein